MLNCLKNLELHFSGVKISLLYFSPPPKLTLALNGHLFRHRLLLGQMHLYRVFVFLQNLLTFKKEYAAHLNPSRIFFFGLIRNISANFTFKSFRIQ